MYSFWRGLFVLLFLAVSAPVFAQPEEDPRKTAKLHIGAFYVTPTLAITNLGVDTNVFNQVTGEQQRDFTFALTPKADVWLPFANRAMLLTKASADLVYFQKFSSERSVNPAVTLRPEIYLNRLTLFAEGSYLNTRQRPTFEIDARLQRTEREGRVGFALRLAPKFSIELAGRERRVRYDTDAFYYGISLSETFDRNERALAGSLRYRWTPLTTVVFLSEAQSDRFVRSPGRNTDSVRFMPGVELKARALVSGNGYVGYRRFTGLSDETPDFDGLVARGALTYTLLGATRFTFTADRDVQYSFERAYPYYVQTGFGLSVRRSLGGRFDVTAGAQRYEYSYRGLFGVTSPASVSSPRVDVTRNVSLSFGYRAARDTRIGFGASYWERTSDTASYRDYNGLRIGLMLDYGF